MTETWIVALVAPAILTVLGWMTNRMDKTAKLVTLLQGEIERLDQKVKKLEENNEIKDITIAQERATIQEAYKCDISSDKCPVLIKQTEFNNCKIYEQRLKEQQSRQHPAFDCDLPGRGEAVY